jgi:2-dehydro-3-deoxyphosphooctonate aldolase (KDO 8-P synthase)
MSPAGPPPPPADLTVRAGSLSLRRGGPLFLIAGPCVLEDDKLPFLVARELRDLCAGLGVPFIFKSSFDKANRTRGGSFRGPGAKEGLALLAEVRKQVGVPVLTDIHEIMAPWDIGWCIEKVRSTGNENVLVTERGVSFGYGALVADMRSIPEMQKFGKPVVFDATHSTQHMSGGPGGTSSGDREMAKVLARAAVAAGCDGVFAETHPEPEKALSDGPNMIRLRDMPGVLRTLVRLREAVASS